MIEMAGMAVAIYVIQAAAAACATDEADGTLEPVLATGVSRLGWLVGHVVNAAVGADRADAGLLGEHGAGRRPGPRWHAHPGAQLVAAGLVQLPGLLVLGGAVLAVVGLAPRWAASISWSLLFVALLLGPLFGPSFKLPQALQDLSPFAHVPKAPAADITAGPLLALTAACLALAAVGWVAIRRRDVALPA